MHLHPVPKDPGISGNYERCKPKHRRKKLWEKDVIIMEDKDFRLLIRYVDDLRTWIAVAEEKAELHDKTIEEWREKLRD
jgi:hypothetical protein